MGAENRSKIYLRRQSKFTKSERLCLTLYSRTDLNDLVSLFLTVFMLLTDHSDAIKLRSSSYFFFFRLASNAFSDIGSVGRIEKKES